MEAVAFTGIPHKTSMIQPTLTTYYMKHEFVVKWIKLITKGGVIID